MAIFYITRDVERAAGLLGEGVFAVTNASPLTEVLKEKNANVYTPPLSLPLTRGRAYSTLELLKLKEVQSFVGAHSVRPSIVVFKTSPQIERECERLRWKLLNPAHEVGAVLEEKIMQYRWLEDSLASLQNDTVKFELPQAWTGQLISRSYKKLSSELSERPIVQFNRGHTGLGTFRLETEDQWKELQGKFPEREVKVSRWFEGEAYTVNAVVTQGTGNREQGTVIVGSISKQLTGIPGCTDNPYATVGNDWSEGARLLDEIKRKIYSCAEAVGNALGERGYRGLFGIDVIVTDDSKVVLTEVNPRQPASASLEAQVQRERGGISVMELHMKALVGEEAGSWKLEAGDKITNYKLQITNKPEILNSKFQIPLNGFQLFFRNIEDRLVQLQKEFIPGRYRASETGIEFIEKAASVIETHKGEVFAFSVSNNERVKPGGELLRIQSKNGMIDALGKDWKRVIDAIRAQLEAT